MYREYRKYNPENKQIGGKRLERRKIEWVQGYWDERGMYSVNISFWVTLTFRTIVMSHIPPPTPNKQLTKI